MKRLTALVTIWATNNRVNSWVRELSIRTLSEVKSIRIRTASCFFFPERANENHIKFVGPDKLGCVLPDRVLHNLM